MATPAAAKKRRGISLRKGDTQQRQNAERARVSTVGSVGWAELEARPQERERTHSVITFQNSLDDGHREQAATHRAAATPSSVHT